MELYIAEQRTQQINWKVKYNATLLEFVLGLLVHFSNVDYEPGGLANTSK